MNEIWSVLHRAFGVSQGQHSLARHRSEIWYPVTASPTQHQPLLVHVRELEPGAGGCLHTKKDMLFLLGTLGWAGEVDRPAGPSKPEGVFWHFLGDSNSPKILA